MTTKLNHTEAQLPTGTWNLDQAQTTVTVTAKKMSFITVPATLTVSAGTIEIDHDHNIVNVEIIADAASYTSSNDKRDTHVRSNDFLDVDNHPTITFHSGKVTVTPDGYHANGSVTLKGQSSPIEVAIDDVEFDSRTGSFSAVRRDRPQHSGCEQAPIVHRRPHACPECRCRGDAGQPEMTP